MRRTEGRLRFKTGRLGAKTAGQDADSTEGRSKASVPVSEIAYELLRFTSV
jgi:hypothetical protein